jgi:hypothetical protein
MRRLTLILSDLYLPARATRASIPKALPLPAFEWLLRFSHVRRIDDWRRWLARELGAATITDWPVAHVCALAHELPPESTWMATPVALEARLDHVRLRDRGVLRLPPDQQRALRDEFEKVFGGDLALFAEGSPSLLLRGGPRSDIATHDPARLLDSDIGDALPRANAAAGDLRRLGAEIEMWLHSSAVNTAREAGGQRRVSSLWLWGGGEARAASAEKPRFEPGDVHLLGEDNLVRALLGLANRDTTPDIPRAFGDLAGAAGYVEFAPMSGRPSHALPEIERHWFAPARNALLSGELEELRIVANDRMFAVRAPARFKFWRRRRNWLESLHNPAMDIGP